jgi:transcriptional regulator with XRE-family HTH domain
MGKNRKAAMDKVREKFKESGISLQELGLKMGYPQKTARQSAFQFMKGDDPRISMIQKYSFAMGIPMDELVHPVRRGLELILIPLRQLMPLRRDAIKKIHVRKMLEYVDPVLERCRLYQKCCAEYFPESKHLAPFFKELEKCRQMPTSNENEKRTFILQTDVCLDRLQSEIEKMMQ